jgi:hypothetical protein
VVLAAAAHNAGEGPIASRCAAIPRRDYVKRVIRMFPSGIHDPSSSNHRWRARRPVDRTTLHRLRRRALLLLMVGPHRRGQPMP